MIKFLLPLFICCSLHAQIVIRGATLRGATVGTTNTTGGGGGGDITTGLVARWTWDVGTGTSISDVTGNGHDGTFSGTATFTTGKIGPFAARFDGSGGAMSITAITTTTTFTFACWVFRNGGTGFQNLIVEGNQKGIYINGGKIDYYFSGDHQSNTVIPTGAWHHVAVVCISGSFTFYLDGVADGTGTGGSSFNGNGVGGDNGGGSEELNGDMDDTRLYSRGLSQLDITTLYTFTGP